MRVCVVNDGVFTMKTITIEFRIDEGDEEAANIIEKAAKAAAKHLFTKAQLVAGKRKPQIALYTGDNFSSTEEIMLTDDDDTLESN